MNKTLMLSQQSTKQEHNMNCYLISYDLIDEKNYPALHQAITKVALQYCKPLLSVYIIKSNYDYVEIRDLLQQSIDKDDKLLVIKADGRAWATLNISEDVTNQMHSYY